MRTIVKDGKISINSQLADIHKQLKDYFKNTNETKSMINVTGNEEYIDFKSMSARLRDILN